MKLSDLPPQLRDQASKQLGQEKRRKYGNEPTEFDGHKFDSKLEARRYQELVAEQALGAITQLKVKPSFALYAPVLVGFQAEISERERFIIGNISIERIGSYTPEFTYLRNGALIVEDCKSAATRMSQMFQWKAKHFAAQYGIRITVVEARRKRRT